MQERCGRIYGQGRLKHQVRASRTPCPGALKRASWAQLALLSGAFVACRFGYELEAVGSGTAGGGAAGAPVDTAGSDGTTTGGTGTSPAGGAPPEAGQSTVDGGGADVSGSAGTGGSGGCIATGAEVCDGRDNDCTGSVDDGNVCATGCEGHEQAGHGYMFCTTPLTWTEAESACEAQGFQLVRVDDAAELTWLLGICFAAAGSNNTASIWPWLGANDLAVDGEWRWADGTQFWQGTQTGGPVDNLYNHWAQGQPVSKDSCGAMQNNGSDSLWSAQPCTSLHPYTCESP